MAYDADAKKQGKKPANQPEHTRRQERQRASKTRQQERQRVGQKAAKAAAKGEGGGGGERGSAPNCTETLFQKTNDNEEGGHWGRAHNQVLRGCGAAAVHRFFFVVLLGH